MPSQPKSPRADQADLPGFAPLQGNDQTPPDPPESPTPSTASSRQPPYREPASTVPDSASQPSPISISPEDFEDELTNLGANAFELGGIAINRFMRKRNRTPLSTLWLATDDEAEAFGGAVSRMALRRVPEELRQGDPADLIVMGSVVVGYAMHNMAGVDGATMEHPQRPGEHSPPPTQAPPPPAPPAPTPGPTAPVEAEPATPTPPSVIDPGI